MCRVSREDRRRNSDVRERCDLEEDVALRAERDYRKFQDDKMKLEERNRQAPRGRPQRALRAASTTGCGCSTTRHGDCEIKLVDSWAKKPTGVLCALPASIAKRRFVSVVVEKMCCFQSEEPSSIPGREKLNHYALESTLRRLWLSYR
ncbi:hypothetical protein EVAR_21725_1 [Eumeta japonica]|uniref:Uncharacterized protein n=1 Tax=Eumeta variegata TaxID=151549 RepID=A0A4C1W7T7_EUMVA|nr:hypothetical protein EVAR_21725_1 [Eumeta japonica]